MSGQLLSDGPRAAIFGKLPAHGDFVRRGDPALVQRLDAWLTAEVERFAQSAGADFDERLANMPTWCFRLPGDISGALTASRDKVGRLYPFVAAAGSPEAPAEKIASLITTAREEGLDADETNARLLLIASDEEGAAGERVFEGWWRPTKDVALGVPARAMATGTEFAHLFDMES